MPERWFKVIYLTGSGPGRQKENPRGARGQPDGMLTWPFAVAFGGDRARPGLDLDERMGEDTLKVQTYPAKADMARASALRNRQDTRFGQGTPTLTRDPTRTEVPRSGGQSAPCNSQTSSAASSLQYTDSPLRENPGHRARSPFARTVHVAELSKRPPRCEQLRS